MAFKIFKAVTLEMFLLASTCLCMIIVKASVADHNVYCSGVCFFSVGISFLVDDRFKMFADDNKGNIVMGMRAHLHSYTQVIH